MYPGLTHSGPGRPVHPGVSPGRALPRRPPAPEPRAAGVMDGRGAGGLSGLIDEVRADGRRVTRGGRRRARGGGRAQTRRRSGSAPAGRPRPGGAPRPGSAEGAAGAEARPGPGARARPRFLSAGASLPAPGAPALAAAARPEPSLPRGAPSPARRRPQLRSYPGARGRASVQAAAAARLPRGSGRALEAGSAAANVAQAAQCGRRTEDGGRRTAGFTESLPRDVRGGKSGRR